MMVRMSREETLQMKLAALTDEHRRLDDKVDALAADPMISSFELRRLKKRKLALRDAIEIVRDRLTPDIIA